MAALCHFPTPPSPPSLSNLLSRSKTRSLLIQNPKPNFTTITSEPRRFSSPAAAASSSEAASTSAIDDLVSPSLGEVVRRDFSTLHQAVNGFNRVYFDNATASKMPDAVLKAMNDYYELYNSNVHRGVHSLSAKATDAYELARAKVANFINATEHREIVFTRNASEAINLVAYSWGLPNLRSGDEILLTIAEHHSAIAPWQLIAKKTGATLKYVGLTADEVPDIQELKKLLSTKTKLVVTHHVSNTLGFVLPINEIVAWSHDAGAKVLVDACQSLPHMVVDVQKLDADFLVASSHKMCGPTGIGFLYGNSKILSPMPPYLGGGEMIADVFLDYSTFADPPSRFEAGTPAIAEAIGLGAAIDYLTSIGMQKIHDYEKELANYLYQSLLSVPNVHIYGPPPTQAVERSPLCSFTVENIPSKAIASHIIEKLHVAIGSGHHCTQPLHHYLGIEASSRASLRFYNSKEEVDYFVEALTDTIKFYTS